MFIWFKGVAVNLLASPERRYTLGGVLLALFLGALDQTIVATALPRIVSDLRGLERYTWIVTAYLLTFTVATPIYGKLADVYSRKRMELIAIVIFLVGSVLCGLAGEFGALPLLGDGMNQLIVFRALQGLGGGGLFAMAFIIIADLFPPAERGRYQGLVGAVFALSSVIGPFVGGVLTDHGDALIPGVAGWRWVFYVNLPLGFVALWFIATRMPVLSPLAAYRRLDYLSMLWFTGALAAFVLGLQLDKQVHPWSAPETFLFLGGAALLLGLFLLRSRSSPSPVLDLTLFRNRVFTTSAIALFLMGAAFLNIVLFAPLFLINVLSVSATEAGLSMIPFSLGTAAGSTLAGQLVSRFGHYRWFMLAGEGVVLVGVYLLTTLTPQASPGQVALYLALCGLGLGPTMPLFPLAIQNAVDVRKLGQATSASLLFRQIGGVVGTAVMGTVLAVTLMRAMPETTMAVSDMLEKGRQNGLAAIAAQYDSLAAELNEALARHDGRALERTLRKAKLPPVVEHRLWAAFNGTAAADSLQRFVAQQLGTVREQMLTQLRSGFAEAILRIYRYVLGLILAGFAVTCFIPELPLRRTHEPSQSLLR
ncbi:Multidrug resistance protein 3 [bacterium HR18]|nr:Multidrug resistance protein 3 [bacterium HR18]